MDDYFIGAIHGIYHITATDVDFPDKNVSVALRVNGTTTIINIDGNNHNLVDMTLREITDLAYSIYKEKLSI
ncbi:hypothetical protein PXH59_10045 [Xenorhabdus sp. SF857]|uniref:hypothetical protein n=1 Tax=Xenorhabdus bakwenae TaxID=3026967 RepID=UPI00255829AD|nr:hypothetical protein [Xenorhabdus sp. SF857]WFQ81343.1 hypothetical protein PXH59_10045 [Xenorhabdus sp. SF857]